MKQLTDEQLIERYRNGERGALDTLVSRYARPMYHFIYGYVRDASQAEDSVQDTFVKMWRYLGRFDNKKKFKTWLFTIAKRTALDALKKKKTISFSLLEGEEGERQFGESIVDPDAFLEKLFEKKENGERVSAALDTLSGPYRSVLYLHYREGLTFREIGEILEEPIDTVKSRHRRALLILKKIISES